MYTYLHNCVTPASVGVLDTIFCFRVIGSYAFARFKQKFFSAQINQQSEQYNFSKELLFLINQNKCKYSYELNIFMLSVAFEYLYLLFQLETRFNSNYLTIRRWRNFVNWISFSSVQGRQLWRYGGKGSGGKGYGSVKNNFLPLICGGSDEEKSPGPGDIKILFEGYLG